MKVSRGRGRGGGGTIRKQCEHHAKTIYYILAVRRWGLWGQYIIIMHSFIPKHTHKVPVSRHCLDRSVSTSTQVDKGQDNQVMISTIKEPSLKFMNNLCMELNQAIFNPTKIRSKIERDPSTSPFK